MTRLIQAFTLAMVCGVFASGCDEAETAFDCARVCERYQECFDEDYDVGACRETCRDKAEEDETWAAKADACEACIDDMSCSAATFNCSTECVGIVP